MAKDEALAINDAVHKLQLYLLEGIQDENQLFAAGSLMSQSDYQDVVIERSIVNVCGYPLCQNPLPSERPRKGRYRIALKEHKVYDLQETYMYCSTECVVNSRSFAGSLQEDRCSALDPVKLNEIMQRFEGSSLGSKADLGKNGDLGLSELKIQEKVDAKAGEVSMEEWIGPSNAIEGYVPQRDRSTKPSSPRDAKKGPKAEDSHPSEEKDLIVKEMDFSSVILTQDEYSVSKSSSFEKPASHRKIKETRGRKGEEDYKSQKPVASLDSYSELKESSGKAVTNVITEVHSDRRPTDSRTDSSEVEGEVHCEKATGSGAALLKSSLRSSGAKKETRSVTWADERTDSCGSKALCDFEESKDKKTVATKFKNTDDGKEADVASVSVEIGKDEDSYRFASAEACAVALSQAAEAVASGESDISEAVSEAGLIILPPTHEEDEVRSDHNSDMVDPDPARVKWPSKPGTPNYDLFESEDTWYDGPPEGFSLALSPFATMFMALFAWISSSSLAFIYGRDESFHEEYLSLNGKEYPRKIVLIDGRSSEIKHTLAGCLARALPGLVTDLRLPIPVSTLEQGMSRLLDTMSFTDPLPAFRMKQWQVIVLLFLDALCISRIPALAPYMTGRRIMLPKVLEGAQISTEEYEIMKDLIIPLGRVPQLSMQSGG